ncbi:MAG: hypothetical protein IT378_17680 [Sandaracinaceae bacterium]|nr:hypothetical protein [Sandaracinaceae bacterium]
MYQARHDDKQGVAVWWLDRPSSDEWRRFTVDIVRVARWSHVSTRPSVLLRVEHWSPDPRQRSQLAELMGDPSFRASVAFVTESAEAFGFWRAIAWMHEAAPYELAPFSDADDAIDWLQAQRERRLESLHRLVQDIALARAPTRMTERF